MGSLYIIFYKVISYILAYNVLGEKGMLREAFWGKIVFEFLLNFNLQIQNKLYESEYCRLSS